MNITLFWAATAIGVITKILATAGVVSQWRMWLIVLSATSSAFVLAWFVPEDYTNIALFVVAAPHTFDLITGLLARFVVWIATKRAASNLLRALEIL